MRGEGRGPLRILGAALAAEHGAEHVIHRGVLRRQPLRRPHLLGGVGGSPGVQQQASKGQALVELGGCQAYAVDQELDPILGRARPLELLEPAPALLGATEAVSV